MVLSDSLPPRHHPGESPGRGWQWRPPGRRLAPTTRYGDRGGTMPSAAGRRPGSGARPGRRLRSSGHPSLEVGEQLPIAEGLASRPRQAAGPGHQRTDLLQEAEIHEAVEPLGDAPVEVDRVMTDPDQRDRGRRVPFEPRAEGRERAARPQGDLEGPDQPSAVGRGDAPGGHRVELDETVVEGPQGAVLSGAAPGTGGIQLLLQSPGHLGIAAGKGQASTSDRR